MKTKMPMVIMSIVVVIAVVGYVSFFMKKNNPNPITDLKPTAQESNRPAPDKRVDNSLTQKIARGVVSAIDNEKLSLENSGESATFKIGKNVLVRLRDTTAANSTRTGSLSDIVKGDTVEVLLVETAQNFEVSQITKSS